MTWMNTLRSRERSSSQKKIRCHLPSSRAAADDRDRLRRRGGGRPAVRVTVRELRGVVFDPLRPDREVVVAVVPAFGRRERREEIGEIVGEPRFALVDQDRAGRVRRVDERHAVLDLRALHGAADVVGHVDHLRRAFRHEIVVFEAVRHRNSRQRCERPKRGTHTSTEPSRPKFADVSQGQGLRDTSAWSA